MKESNRGASASRPWFKRRADARKQPAAKLSAGLVENARKGKATPGVYREPGGLRLRVDDSGAARWVLRVSVAGQRHDYGLGGVRDVSLADARERASEARKKAREGKDPTARRVASLTFKEAAEKVHTLHKATWRNAKHSDQWINTLRDYAFPKMGRKAVADIEPSDVLGVLTPIWVSKAETARRVRQRIGMVLDWATTAGYRSPLAVDAAHAVRATLPKRKKRPAHHPALPWRAVPAFLRGVRHGRSQEGARLALEFLTLTAARTTEVIEGRRAEVDLEAKVWTVPAGRTKGEREHRVPLSDQAVAVLETAFARWPSAKLLFCGRYTGKPLSNMALLMLMRRMGLKAGDGRVAVPHGLRSSFRDWVAETRRKDRDLAEAALAHVLDSKVEAAYQHWDFLDERRELMQAWADFATGKPAKAGEKPAKGVRPADQINMQP